MIIFFIVILSLEFFESIDESVIFVLIEYYKFDIIIDFNIMI